VSFSTIYDVRLRYSVDGRGAAGTRALTSDVRGLAREAGNTSAIFGRLGAAVAGAFGARAAGKALIGFNATVQDTKSQIAGMLALTKHTDLVDQLGVADRLFASLQQRAKTLPGTTAEYTQMAGMLVQPITDAGLGMKDLEDLTVNSVVGAKALGVAWDVAARDIDQALRGQFHSVDVFSGKLLGSVGFKGEEGRGKFNAMSASQRADTLRGALMQKQLTQLATQQGENFNGALSTLQDTIQQFLGKVGLPLFKQITTELKQWNVWIDANSDRIDSWTSKLANGLMEAFDIVKEIGTEMFPIIKDVFGVVRDAARFVADNKDLLIQVTKGYALYKGAQMGAGLVRGAAGGAGGLFRGLTDSFDKLTGIGSTAQKAEGGLMSLATTLASGLPGIAQFVGLLAGAALLPIFASPTNKWRDEDARHRAEEMKTAKDYTSTLDKIDGFRERLKNIGVNPDDSKQDLGGLKDELQQLQGARTKYEDALLQKAIDQGVVREDLDKSGTRKLFLTGSPGASVSKEFVDSVATVFQMKAREAIAESQAGGGIMPPTAAFSGGRGYFEQFVGAPSGTDADAYKPNITLKPNVNITVQRIEVQSDDPDRFAFGLVEAFEDVVRNPGAAAQRAARLR
jgi:hypothetical protein